MQNTVMRFIHKLIVDRAKRRKVAIALLVLSIFVAGGVFWQLRITGITMTGEACCGIPEHSHTEECVGGMRLICGYDESAAETYLACTAEEHVHGENCYNTVRVLICENKDADHVHDDILCYEEHSDLKCTVEAHTHTDACYAPVPEEQRHVHTDACYEPVYICGKEAHAHTVACYSDLNADLEAPADWEKDLPKNLTGKLSHDLLSIAKSQQSYTESTRNYQVAEDGVTKKGYTRYGEWYNNPYGDWNAMFACFCLHYAGIEQDVLPYNSGVYAWAVELGKRSLLAAEGTPAEGDLVFFDTDGDGKADRVGIVFAVNENKNTLSAIEGDCDDKVGKAEYDISKMFAFVAVSALNGGEALDGTAPFESQPDETVPFESVPDETVPDETVSNETLPEATEPEAELAYHEDIPVEFYLDRESAPEESVWMTISGMMPENANARAYWHDLELPGEKVLWAIDLVLMREDGSVWDVKNAGLSVTMPMPQYYALGEKDDFGVYRVDGETLTRVPTQWNGEKESVTFTADSPAVYAMLAEQSPVTTLDDLLKALQESSTDSDPISLGADIEISKDVELNLNGHTIQASGYNFEVKSGGSLTIKDSKAAVDVADSGVATNANKAGKLATLNGDTLTYYVTETEVTNTAIGATTEKLVTHTVKLSGKITGGSITVESGGSFTMNGGALCDVENAYAVKSTGGTITVNDGYICGSSGGIKADGGTVTMNGGVIAGNKADWGGGVHVENGIFNMFGGVISGNAASAYGGGGVYVNNSTALLYHGYITNNVGAESDPEHTGGGGVLCYSNCVLAIGDGAAYDDAPDIYITANTACSGGGITAFNMYGGTGNEIFMQNGYVTGNLATKAEGGGMAIRAESSATITGGYITNNVKATAESWGGGGIFGQEYSGITITHALITNNTAKGFGGGVTGCSTGTVLVQNNEGAAVYGNRADGSANHMASSNKAEDHAALEDPVFMQGGTYQDYFCALVSMVKGEMLGGGSENWYGSADSERVSTDSADDVLTASIRMGLNAKPTDEDIAKARAITRVFINGNSSDTHGGGLLANGIMVLGNNDDKFELPGGLTFNAKKALNGEFGENKLADYRFGFRLLDENKVEISTAYNDKNGLISFPKLKFTKEGTYTYYMEELQPEYPSVTMDTTVWKFEVVVTKSSIIPEKGDGVSSYDLFKPTNCYIYRDDKLLNQWQSEGAVKQDTWVTEKEDGTTQIQKSVTDFHVDVFDLASGEQSFPYTFNNTFADKVGIEVHKVWKDADGNVIETPPENSVTVYLTKNGQRHTSTADADKSPVILDDSNNWSYSWSELTGRDDAGKEIIWGIEEVVPDGWEAHLSYTKPGATDPDEPEQPSGPQPVTSPENGKTYYIGNLDISKLLVIGDGDKTWDLPQWNDQNLPNAKYVVGSDGGQFYLMQGTSYLYLNPMNEWNGMHYFLKKSQDSKTLFSVDGAGKLYTVIDCTTYYISTNAGSGVTVTTDSSSVMILYTIPDTSAPGGGDTPSGGANGSVVTITNMPKREEQFYGFTVKKVDADDETIILPGAQFQLTDENGTKMTFTQDRNGVYHFDGHWNQITDLVIGEDGIFRVEGLSAGIYTLTEIKAPEGYPLPAGDAAKHTVTLPGADTGSVIQIENGKEATYALDVTKVDAEDNTIPLAGVKFQLLDKDKLTVKFTVSDGVYVYAADGGTEELITGDDGKLQLSGLPEGTYYLLEKKTLDGYVIGDAAEQKVELGPKNSSTTLAITVENKRCYYELPQTGGMGTVGFYLCGGLMMAAGMWLFIHNRKRERGVHT